MTRPPRDTTQELRSGASRRAREIGRRAAIREGFSCVVSRTATAPPTTRRRLTQPHPFRPRTMEIS